MKILLFPLSDMTQEPHAGLIIQTPRHLKRPCSPGRYLIGDCWASAAAFPPAGALPEVLAWKRVPVHEKENIYAPGHLVSSNAFSTFVV